MRLESRAVAALAALGSLAVPAGASAATKVVDMGPPPATGKILNRSFGADANAYFPSAVSVHVGDKVRFMPTGFHSIDFPPKGKAALPFAGPTGQNADAKDAAGNAFWFNGQPAVGFTPAMAKSGFGKSFTYTGAKRVASGLPLGSGPPKPVTVKFAKAGAFTYFCNLHPGMKGTVRVVPKSKSVPSASADAARVKKQAAEAVATAKRLRTVKPPANTLDVGVAASDGVEYFDIVPKTLSVPVGTTVTFRMTPASYEAHTATTGPGDPRKEGATTYLAKLASSFESPLFAAEGVYPSDPPQAGTASLTPTSHGNGFWNSGVIDTDKTSPFPSSNKVTFAQAGTYEFYCLIHTNMHATVTVR